jgi:hypothetical protein
MKITFQRSGGFAGVRVSKTLDTADLTPTDASKLQQLITAADFFRLPETITASKPQPDRFQYRVTVADNEQEHTVMMSEEVLPQSLRPLVEWLMQTARAR